jgi:hypothetical protein
MATTLALESTAAATGKGKIKSFSRFWLEGTANWAAALPDAPRDRTASSRSSLTR